MPRSTGDSSYRTGGAFAAAVDRVRRGEQDLDAAVAGLVGQLTDDELLWLLDGDLTITVDEPAYLDL